MSWKRKKRMTWTNVLVLIGVCVVGIWVAAMLFLPLYLNNAREQARRAACSMNLGSIGKGISMYQASYKEKYPALANSGTDAQGGIDEAPEMIAITDPYGAAFLNGDVKGNGSVNAYYLLVHRGYVEEDGFKCPSDDSFEAPEGRGQALGFDGWKNLSYALQPTSLDAAVFSARPGYSSKAEMVIASDQVVDRDTPLTKTDNRPEEDNTINHGYEYANVLTVSNLVRRETRQKGADSIISKWGWDKDEIYALGMKGKVSPDTTLTKQANDSILMGKEGGE
jgi:hypothetical protein